MKRKTKSLTIFMAGVMFTAGALLGGAWKISSHQDVRNHVARLPALGLHKPQPKQENSSPELANMKENATRPSIKKIYTNRNSISAMASDGENMWIGSTGGLVRIPLNADFPEKTKTISEEEVRDLLLTGELGSPEVRDLLYKNEALTVLTTAGVVIIKKDPPFGTDVKRIATPQDNNPENWTALAAYKDGVIIGTDREGLLELHGEAVRPFKGGEALKSSRVTGVAGYEGAVFAGTLGDGVFCVKDGKAQQLSQGDGLPDEWIIDLEARKDGLYIATTRGMAIYGNGEIKPAPQNGPLDKKHLTALGDCQDSAGSTKETLCVGTMTSGILALDYENNPRVWESSLNRIVSIKQAGGRTWIGTSDGTKVSTSSGWISVKADGPPSNDITTMERFQGKLWTGTFDKGLASFDGERWRHYTVADGLASDMINHMAATDEYLWIATMKGAVRFDGKDFKKFTEKQGLASDHVLAVAVWNHRTAFATARGITVLENGKMTSYGPEQGLPSGHVYTLATHDDRLYAGTLLGVAGFDGKFFTTYNFEKGQVPDNWINAMAGFKDKMWVGTYDAGLASLGPEEEKLYLPEDHIEYGWVNPNAMYAEDDALWIGLTNGGLLFYDGKGFVRMTREHGLPGNDVTAFKRSGGELAVSTRTGLAFLGGENAGLSYNHER